METKSKKRKGALDNARGRTQAEWIRRMRRYIGGLIHNLTPAEVASIEVARAFADLREANANLSAARASVSRAEYALRRVQKEEVHAGSSRSRPAWIAAARRAIMAGGERRRAPKNSSGVGVGKADGIPGEVGRMERCSEGQSWEIE